MTNNTKPTAAKDGEKPGLMPKLRFLELRATGWIQKKLEDVAPLQRGFDLPSDLIRPGNIPIVYSNGIQKYHEVGMATAPGLVTGRSGTIGKLHFIESGDYWPHNTSLWVTSFNGNVHRFVFYLYDSIGMSRFSSGSGVPTLNRNDVHAFGVSIPSSSAEQQKIADCLSSLDELIAAQARKVDALKTHKKGLVQQLFPREGETQPPLRFPEFKNFAEWVKTTIGELNPFVTSGSRGWAPFYAKQGDLFVRITNLWRNSICLNLTDSKFVQLPPGESEGVRTQLKQHDVLISITADIGIIGYVDESIPSPAYINQHIALVRFDAGKLCGKFVAYFLASEESQRFFRASTDTGTKAGMSLIGIQKTELMLPGLSEQRRIASCLSSLDALITLETQKLETLKTHKKGLMQQLFPSVGGVAGEA